MNSSQNSMNDILVFSSQEALIQAGMEIFLQAGAEAQQRSGQFSVVLSGGSTPLPLYQNLASINNGPALDWDRIHFFWGDERAVGPDHPDSNFRAAYQALLEPRLIPDGNIHRIQGELPPREAAQTYQENLQRWFGSALPRFDLILLGLGEDGHTASLFPGTAVVNEASAGEEGWITAVHVPQLDTWRITMDPWLINNAVRVVFLVSGGSKAGILTEVIQGPYQPETYPAQLIKPGAGKLTWLLDQEAAAGLGSDPMH